MALSRVNSRSVYGHLTCESASVKRKPDPQSLSYFLKGVLKNAIFITVLCIVAAGHAPAGKYLLPLCIFIQSLRDFINRRANQEITLQNHFIARIEIPPNRTEILPNRTIANEGGN